VALRKVFGRSSFREAFFLPQAQHKKKCIPPFRCVRSTLTGGTGPPCTLRGCRLCVAVGFIHFFSYAFLSTSISCSAAAASRAVFIHIHGLQVGLGSSVWVLSILRRLLHLVIMFPVAARRGRGLLSRASSHFHHHVSSIYYQSVSAFWVQRVTGLSGGQRVRSVVCIAVASRRGRVRFGRVCAGG
jgi:hypothetical protein